MSEHASHPNPADFDAEVQHTLDELDLQLTAPFDRVMEQASERSSRRLTRREMLVEILHSLVFVAGVVALLLCFDSGESLELGTAAAFAVGIAVASLVAFPVGSAWVVPSELVVVPAFFVLPPELVPLVVFAGVALSRIYEGAVGRTPIDRLIVSGADSLPALGPAAVLLAFGAHDPDLGDWPIYVLAFFGQLVLDETAMGLRDWAVSRTSFRIQSKMLPTLVLVQIAVSPAGLLAAFAATGTPVGPLAFLLLLPVVALLAIHARERSVRFEQAIELSRAYRGTTLLLADVLDRSDEYTGSHSRTVLRLAMRVADELKLPPIERQVVESAALLHDVGKIAIPEDILQKPGRLTDDEFELMKTHTVEGERLLEHVGGPLSRIGGIVRSCHERWDGAGYPDGISGERIPLAARIVFACDAFNAMTTDRVYRPAMPLAEAIAELEACAGSQFDPAVVKVLIRVVSHGVEDGWLEAECDVPVAPDAATAA